MAIADGSGLPLAIRIESASPHEVTLVDRTLESCFLAQLPKRLIGDTAYDSDKLDARLAEERGIEMIAPTPRSSKSYSCRRLNRICAPRCGNKDHTLC